jgi:hypothetical protein
MQMLDLAYIKQNAMEQERESWRSECYSSWIAPERVLVMVAEIERLQRNLAGRDEFLVKIGQWQAFVDQLPTRTPPEEPSEVTVRLMRAAWPDRQQDADFAPPENK